MKTKHSWRKFKLWLKIETANEREGEFEQIWQEVGRGSSSLALLNKF